MAGYTSRNFLSLTIPSVLGLSIIWFLKRRSSSSKHTSKAADFEATSLDCIDQQPSLYPMKLKNQEVDSVEETALAEMQLKETECAVEAHVLNGVQQNPKVKVENKTRLYENGNSCSLDEPLTNGCKKDNTLRNGDSKFEITNGMNALCLNGASKAKESLANGNIKCGEIKNTCNGMHNTLNGLETSIDGDCKSKNKVSENNKDPKFPVSNEIKKSSLEDIRLVDAKEKVHVESNVQSSLTCNGLSNGDSKNHCSIEATLSAEEPLTSDTSIELQSSKVSSTSVDAVLTNIDKNIPNKECEMNATSGHSLSLAVCATNSTDEPLSQSPSNPVTIKSSPSHSIVDDSPSVDYVVTDIDPTAPISILTDAEQLAPPVDYVVADSTELLPLPIDAGAGAQAEMLESPGATYCDSLGSSDSGRGASETQCTLAEDHIVYMVYEFEIQPEDCGRLIGRLGRHVKYINKQTNASLVIRKHPCFTDKKLCSITGTEAEINAALKLIRKRFPVEIYPNVTLAQINSIPISTLFSPETLKLSLPEGGVFEALLCSTVSAGHFFLQQPTHPTFYQLPPLTNAMNALYGQTETPILENPTKGNVCAAEIAGGWYRAEVDEVYEDSDSCRLKFLDYGGYADILKTSIRKIKCDFMLIPFQATECYLAGVIPLDDNGWSAEATTLFEQEAQGQLIQGCIVAYAENRVPCVNLYKITGVTSVFINQKLINDGLGRGIAMD